MNLKRKRTKAITLLLCSSLAIFGIGHMGGCQSNDEDQDDDGSATQPSDMYDGWEPEPILFNGQMGVYHPITHVFIANTSPDFAVVCTQIKTIHVQEMSVHGISSVRGGFGAMGGHSGIAS